MKLLTFTKLTRDVAFTIFKAIFNVMLQALKQTSILIPLVPLYVLYKLLIVEEQVMSLGIYVLTPLALLIAFTNLLYARARAVENEQEICIASANKAFKASIYYSASLIWGFIVATINWMLIYDSITYISHEVLIILYAPSFLGLGIAYIEIYQAISRVWPMLKNE